MRQMLLATLMVLMVVSCMELTEQPPERETKQKKRPGYTVINGVERSELALTMRQMYDQMKMVADSLRKGLPVKTNYLEQYHSIHTDHPTEPEKIDEVYQSMASTFLQQYQAFEQSRDNKTEKFNAMVEACLACHQQKCPGPIQAINTLRVQE